MILNLDKYSFISLFTIKLKVNFKSRVFSKNNGSIQKCADELFIHKNTLQYRLNKIRDLTGFSPRNYNDFVVLKIAFLLDFEREKSDG